jgi:hypothetical protein
MERVSEKLLTAVSVAVALRKKSQTASVLTSFTNDVLCAPDNDKSAALPDFLFF